MLRLAAGGGWRGRFEVPSDPRAPTHSTDIVLERGDQPALIEIWNRVDDLGAAARSSDRKLAAVRQRAELVVGSCWLFVDTAANGAIVRRYPAILRARFTGSSAGWVRALTNAAPPPRDPGLAWIDAGVGRLRELRLRTD